ncbi:MAG: homocysteine S-methyltransferase family protein [Alphaproteobacteria bacterium]|nr:homocysteine S-methyltransferase family protein [Alphaproteobacteria bacterium]
MELNELLKKNILILDGAMGTMIQQYNLREEDFRGKVFGSHNIDLKGNNDLLNITQPDIITEIHFNYLCHGADIIETNTFNSNAISMADYDMQNYIYEINIAATNCAKTAISNYQEKFLKLTPKFIAGAIGPLNKTLSLSPDVNKPEYRSLSFNEAKDAYSEQIKALVDGGVDLFIIETIFDTLNAKAAIYAYLEFFEQSKKPKLPLIISGTITDASGRTLSGQTLEAFFISIQHAQPLAIGLNCALGALQMTPFVKELSNLAKSYFISVYPNAGLPNALGAYDESPETMSQCIAEWAKEGWVNMVGGCCGSTPKHIKAIADAVKLIKPRPLLS